MRLKGPSRLAALIRGHPRAAVASLGAVAGVVILASGWWLLHGVPGRTESPPPSDGRGFVQRVSARPTEKVTFEQGCVTSACHTVRDEPEFVHMPAGERACGACHAEDAGGHRYPLLRARAEVCTACHATGLHQAVQHQGMTADGCLGCHKPHGGSTRAMLVAGSASETCAGCHARAEAAVRHPPYAEQRCDLCHDSHGSEAKGLLRAGGEPETCRSCHAGVVATMEASPHSHRGAEGSCSACHAPHTAQQMGLLRAPARELCVSCHAGVGREVSGATVPHDAVLKGEQCIRCHDPHASDRPGMLRDSQAAVCLSCHDRAVTAADGRKVGSMAGLRDAAGGHDAAGHRECSGCHSVHGGTHERLLRERNAALPTGPFDRANYALCFSCHDAKLAEAAGATQFRDGARNLHEVHMKPGEMSRGCSSCHSVHALGEPRLIGKTVNFEGSGWNMPMGFVPTPEGGRCGSGCHEALEYSRRPGGASAGKNGGAP